LTVTFVISDARPIETAIQIPDFLVVEKRSMMAAITKKSIAPSPKKAHVSEIGPQIASATVARL
jgi:hypothetical protein